jgi:hypothetical protein
MKFTVQVYELATRRKHVETEGLTEEQAVVSTRNLWLRSTQPGFVAVITPEKSVA